MVLTGQGRKGTLVGNNAADLSRHHRTQFHRNCRPPGLWWSATRLALSCRGDFTSACLPATLLVCAAFSLPLPGGALSASSDQGSSECTRNGRCTTGPRKDVSWQLPALRRPVVRRALSLPAGSPSAGSP